MKRPPPSVRAPLATAGRDILSPRPLSSVRPAAGQMGASSSVGMLAGLSIGSGAGGSTSSRSTGTTPSGVRVGLSAGIGMAKSVAHGAHHIGDALAVTAVAKSKLAVPSTPLRVASAPAPAAWVPPREPGQLLQDTHIGRIHSAVRLDKPESEISQVVSEVGATMEEAVEIEDPKTGNRCLHVAAQHGHKRLVRFLLQQKADVNAKNSKGQTALHMSVEYDFYFQSVILLENGADPTLPNDDGHEALKGIEGKKEGKDAWDTPLNVLKAAHEKDELDFALTKLEQAAQADPSTLDKAALTKEALKKKDYKEAWDARRFMDVMRKL